MNDAINAAVNAMRREGYTLPDAIETFSDAYVDAALQASLRRGRPSIKWAAMFLGVHRNTLHNILRRRAS